MQAWKKASDSLIGCDVDVSVFVEDLNLLRGLLRQGSHGIVDFIFRDLERLRRIFGGPWLNVEIALDEPLQQFGFKLGNLVGHEESTRPQLKMSPMVLIQEQPCVGSIPRRRCRH